MKHDAIKRSLRHGLPLLVLLGVCPLAAQSGKGGQAGAFLRNGVSARALAMGGAFTALADDPSAGYWNPAGLGLLQSPELIGTYSILSMDRSYNYLSFGMPVGERAGFGFGWINFGVDGIEGRDLAGTVTGTLTNSESAFSLGFGYAVRPDLRVGVGIKYLQHSLADYQSTGYGLDAGVLYQPKPKIALGLTLQDLSTGVSWDTASELDESYPLVYRLGGCVTPFSHPTRFTLDYAGVQNGGGEVRMGVESELSDYFGLRAGYDGSRLVGGAFFVVPLNNFAVEVDYSFGKEAIDQTYNHKVSLRLKFLKSKFVLNAGPQTSQKQVDDRMKVMASQFDARIMKIVDTYPNYALINLGAEQGLKKGQAFQIYRDEKNNGGSVVVYIGEVEVVRVNEKMSAVRVVTLNEGYLLNVGDYLVRKGDRP